VTCSLFSRAKPAGSTYVELSSVSVHYCADHHSYSLLVEHRGQDSATVASSPACTTNATTGTRLSVRLDYHQNQSSMVNNDQIKETALNCETVVWYGSPDRSTASFNLASMRSSPNQHAGQCLRPQWQHSFGESEGHRDKLQGAHDNRLAPTR